MALLRCYLMPEGFFIMYNPHDTICAISTPPGESALAVVRLSGRLAKSITEKVFRGAELKDRYAAYGTIEDKNGDRLDEIIAIWYKGPKSYTAEDLVEMICHGGYVVSERLQSLLIEHGARMAEPGEFTVRAFLNGRLDLTEAEAVNSVIKAKTSLAQKHAMDNLEGKLREKLTFINDKLLESIMLLEAEIDFADEEIDKTDPGLIKDKLNEITIAINELKSTYDIGRISEGRARVAIVGVPNVGKSSLFNAILQSSRAIVTEVPGTTRDYLSEYVNIGGYPVILTDTAGIRESDEDIELLGITRSREMIENSDLCIVVLDCSQPLSDDDNQIIELVTDKKCIVAVNKTDLVDNIPQLNIKPALKEVVYLSAKTSIGIPELINKIKTLLINRDLGAGEGIILSQRQYNCAQKASQSLDNALEAIDLGEPEEIYVGFLHEALDQIGEITGRITSEDILNRIFSQFCIGK